MTSPISETSAKPDISEAAMSELIASANAMAGHLRWAIKVIGAFGQTAQLEAMQSALNRWENQP